MSQEAFDNYSADVISDGMVLYDPDLINPLKMRNDIIYKRVKATENAYKLGRVIVANMIMLGSFAALTNILPVSSYSDAIRASVPKGTEELNLLAFKTGLDEMNRINCCNCVSEIFGKYFNIMK